jgi:hypothetical protein
VQPAIEALLVLPQHHVLTHHHGGLRQTDRQTDRQTETQREDTTNMLLSDHSIWQ